MPLPAAVPELPDSVFQTLPEPLMRTVLLLPVQFPPAAAALSDVLPVAAALSDVLLPAALPHSVPVFPAVLRFLRDVPPVPVRPDVRLLPHYLPLPPPPVFRWSVAAVSRRHILFPPVPVLPDDCSYCCPSSGCCSADDIRLQFSSSAVPPASLLFLL